MDQNQEYTTMNRGTLRRGKTLTRPDRFNAPEPMLKGKDKRSRLDIWVVFSKIVTFWAPSFVLKKVGFPDKQVIQAWREKVSLCFIISLICAIVVFITLFMSNLLCPASADSQNKLVKSVKPNNDENYIFNGFIYQGSLPFSVDSKNKDFIPDITFNVLLSANNKCLKLPQNLQAISFNGCQTTGACEDFSVPAEQKTSIKAGYDWVYLPQNYVVLDGVVLNFDSYLSYYTTPNPGDYVDIAIRESVKSGKDATRVFLRSKDLVNSIDCLKSKYVAGVLTKKTVGCFSVELFQNLSLIVILGVILVRFIMAAAFHWFLSHRLSKTPKRSAGKPIVVKSTSLSTDMPQTRQISNNPNELFTVLLVTCYSEGEDSMRTTVESLANTEYSDDKKMLFIIADGIITGSGNSKSTPEIIVDMLDIDPAFQNPEPQSYIAVADGAKQHNMAKVYCGHYVTDTHRVPVLAVIKCGTPEERAKPKPGNRGKRDSQLILMGFFSRVTYNDRMCPLDYDLFIKTQHLMGVTPDYFETVLMVDADTKVYPSSLKLLTNCLINDVMVMGLCGETKIANKKDSLVTTIQVFEYYISHHLGKGFESVFGGVTCLPGCFCMYRLKAPKGVDDWVPIVTKPEIIQEYSQNVVETLHQKNLLLLGEDRFLTTLMLRNFPNRKMMFVPQAICKTVVPDEFSVLLSQRRRWINSTIHNLLELVMVRNLCGIFCFSMQFVIFMELIGTVVLPVAIIMTYYLIASLFFVSDFKNSLIPLILLVLVLFSPAVLIIITTRKLIYVAWMFVYLLFLFVWNFILPVYSYWHFDDFSWGATRMVEGETKGDSHGKKEGQFNISDVSFKRWEEYERLRLKKESKYTQSSRYAQTSSSKSYKKNNYQTQLENYTEENNNNHHLSQYSLADHYDNDNDSVFIDSSSSRRQSSNKQQRSRPMGPRPLE